MALASGMRLGPYEVVSPLGAGGMGEVYRGLDTRLERTVAIKVLSSELSSSPDIKLRFEREAKTISSLNHPNICSLYDVGCENGTDYLVMEYIEGETLADHLKKGSMPLRQALQVAIEIADALDRAHRSGIIHRDLKPGNIMLTKGGAKLMDFGLAKPISALSAAAKASGVSPLFSAALTKSSPASPLTSVGSIVGTVQYMSPEQIEGIESDARSDIFSFGLVLYEMVSGRRAFAGKTQASIVASILALEPPSASSVQPTLPTTLDTILNACLAKDPADRIQTAHDLKLQLQLFAELGQQNGSVATAPSSSNKMKERVLFAAIAVLVLTAAASSFAWWRSSTQPGKVVRGLLPAPVGGVLSSASPAQVSPDGRFVVYGAFAKGLNQLWLQPFDADTPQPMSGTEGATYPFWSADSRSVGFFANGKLKRAEIAGGPPQTICDVNDGRGGTWNADGVILYGSRITPILKVSAAGGQPVPATEFDKSKGHGTHRWPSFLPDGKHFIYMSGITGNDNPRNEIYVGSLDSIKSTPLLAASSSMIFAQGYLIYRRETSLMAHPFDAGKRVLTGDAVPIVEHIKFDPNTSLAYVAASQNGLLVYQTGTSTTAAQQLIWYDHTGKELGLASDRSMGYSTRLSPDAKRAAITLLDSGGNADIWMYDLARSVKTRLTFDPSRETDPVWFPDGLKVAFASERDGNRQQMFAKNADGSGAEIRLHQSSDADVPDSISRDGRYLAFTRRTLQGSSGLDIWLLPLTGDPKPVPFLQTPFGEHTPRFSPDSKWMAYGSDESGKLEVYITTFPQASSKWQVSNGGGRETLWSASGKEIYYLTLDNQLMVVPLTFSANSVQPGIARKLFQVFPVPGRKVYDVARDGRVLVNSMGEDKSTAPVSFTMNWPQTVRR